jgi:hypothetical protein
VRRNKPIYFISILKKRNQRRRKTISVGVGVIEQNKRKKEFTNKNHSLIESFKNEILSRGECDVKLFLKYSYNEVSSEKSR